MADDRPNVLLVLSDDHAAHAISAYGSRINRTPNLDRIAARGMRFDAAFCTNSICTPSRAAILTGTYNHVNGVTTLDTPLDNRLWTFPQAMQAAGYRTGLFGKWHLGHGPDHDPTGFDEWRILPGQGHYHDPVMLGPGGEVIERGGYVTDLITDDCIDFIDRDDGRPFLLLCHHKAAHRAWESDAAHAGMYEDESIPEPPTFRDDLAGRSAAVRAVRMGMLDLDPFRDLGAAVPAGLSQDDEIGWRYQRFIKRYLRVVAALDDSVGRLLDHLDRRGIAERTIVIYTSDQGFFLGDHGWFDKRLMYEQSLAMPLLIDVPGRTAPGSTSDDIVVNVDLAPTILELAGVDVPNHVQGRSLAPLLDGRHPDDWPTSMYYRYWMHHDGAHGCPAHYGVRTRTHKLICYDHDPFEWELYDLVADPQEVANIVDDPDAATALADLRAELARLQAAVGDHPVG